MLKLCHTSVLVLTLLASVALAAGVELEPKGFELSGKTELSLDTRIPSSERSIKFWYEVTGEVAGKILVGTFIAENVGDAAPPNTEIVAAEAKLEAGHKGAAFTMHVPDAGWPLGQYRLEVRLGGELLHMQKFEIVAGT